MASALEDQEFFLEVNKLYILILVLVREGFKSRLLSSSIFKSSKIQLICIGDFLLQKRSFI